MLRASARHTGRPFDLTAIAHPDRDSRLPAGRELLRFVTALMRTGDDLPGARERLSDVVGVAGVIRAAAVTGNFQMMNRLVDATGVPIGASLRAIAADLALDADSPA
jgi:hypothetical protein